MSARISHYIRPLIISEDETKEKTLRSYVDRLDFKSYRAAHKPRLTARHRKTRIRWAKKHLSWTEDQWRKVVWSDESRFGIE
ncbi:transposase [Rhizopus delemar RA 99-880]|uniref:Transposase n=1 Tax=Rhizopus delemar (strain RA 99-880 / ATCC MYA-4621 / FGSC 9543 / NRRL 43880) TaxID=246409 RepID=I1C345_RHIO9|nr:transposase [Rhizopus delemar RA 99-880]|eukprot:EIE82875.1 transposase [Rhizopus delemar RA 99-880]